jgi:hypothetical protein
MLNVNIAGGASISLTYIASERIIPGYSHAFLLLLEVTMPFFFPFQKHHYKLSYADMVEA